ncbi:C40 family peptidase [Jiangella anatolica]|uniref:NlpC/P60 domain-containing protein n=1 Tax=Jiangella anatolica TaxID=2670374 RepID=A0A2W2BN61_9ACTN|nr:C40 family peptidase [Jiangella anatolica]PZF86730.1 hypothetical protein C1I92_00735 [Jiangella anatolica]
MTGTVVVAVAAPLWVTAEAARAGADFDPASFPSYRAWLRELMGRHRTLRGRLDSVALRGEPVRVLDRPGDGVVTVELPEQPNGRSGYVGHVRAAHLGPDRRRAVTHVVAPANGPAAGLAAGSTVQLLGPPVGGAAPVLLPSGERTTCPAAALRPLGPPAPAPELLRIATGFLGVPYVWGGTDDAGIDCSGLVHLAARIGGHRVPRDAHLQWADTRIDADWGDLRPGDLLFFGAGASLDGIDHVGLYAGGGRMLHAPEEGRAVTLEPLSDRARRRAVAFGRLATAA